jgi:glycerol-3-phosphate acyltransferase PlsY
MRSVSKKAGIAGLLLDALKGGLPTWLLPLWLAPVGGAVGEWALSPGDVGVLVAMAAILGHVFSPFLAFRGGKGVATSLGAFMALAPVPMLITMAICLPVMALTRYVALGSVMGAVIFPALVWAMGGFGLLLRIVAVVLGLLIIWRHRSNIKRLLQGTEKKV